MNAINPMNPDRPPLLNRTGLTTGKPGTGKLGGKSFVEHAVAEMKKADAMREKGLT